MKRRGYSVCSAGNSDGEVHIYIMQSGDSFKVGLTRDPRQRLSALQSSSVIPVTLINSWIIRAGVAGDAEHRAHRRLARYHVHGEWFSCSLAAAISAVKDAIYRANSADDKRRREVQKLSPEEQECADRGAALTAAHREAFVHQTCSPPTVIA